MTATLSAVSDAGVVTIDVAGELDARSAPELNRLIDRARTTDDLGRMVLRMDGLTYMSSAGVRCLVFAHQKLPRDVTLELVDVRPEVAETIRLTGFHHSVTLHERGGDDAGAAR